MKLYSKRHHDKKKLEIGTENGTVTKHEIEIRENSNNDKEIIHSVIPLLNKEDVIQT